ncbi:hypothetical protein IWX49DRAFT_616397 [Phyllosticta citricarpa]|uniref:Uncharacterized protein n=1 Tax=Phyllosticta citricarpa TaxID=55181 RepID=A0ABR1MRJ8_9PEZI
MELNSLNSEYMFSTGPTSLNPHDQRQASQLSVTHPTSRSGIATFRARLVAEINALRANAARESRRADLAHVAHVDKPATRTLFVRLSQLAVLDARFPPPAPFPHVAAAAAQRAAEAGDAGEFDVPQSRCEWSWIEAGLNPNFAYEGPWGPKTVNVVDATMTTTTTTTPSSLSAAGAAVDLLERPVSPKTVVDFPPRARVRSSSVGGGRQQPPRRSFKRFYATGGSAGPAARMPPQALDPTSPPSVPSQGVQRPVQRPRKNSIWQAKERGTDCGVM